MTSPPSRGDPRPRASDFADPREFQAVFREWCIIRALALRDIQYPHIRYLTAEELRQRLGH